MPSVWEHFAKFRYFLEEWATARGEVPHINDACREWVKIPYHQRKSIQLPIGFRINLDSSANAADESENTEQRTRQYDSWRPSSPHETPRMLDDDKQIQLARRTSTPSDILHDYGDRNQVYRHGSMHESTRATRQSQGRYEESYGEKKSFLDLDKNYHNNEKEEISATRIPRKRSNPQQPYQHDYQPRSRTTTSTRSRSPGMPSNSRPRNYTRDRSRSPSPHRTHDYKARDQSDRQNEPRTSQSRSISQHQESSEVDDSYYRNSQRERDYRSRDDAYNRVNISFSHYRFRICGQAREQEYHADNMPP